MNTQEQINTILNWINLNTTDRAGLIHVKHDGRVYVFIEDDDESNGSPLYYTIWSIYSNEQIEDLENQLYEKRIADGEKIAHEVYQSIQDEAWDRDNP